VIVEWQNPQEITITTLNVCSLHEVNLSDVVECSEADKVSAIKHNTCVAFISREYSQSAADMMNGWSLQ